ncbi:hypothetical protein WH47_06178 [Habropoda laboriosa]|uniref:Uncharacterized protein n=1 Tax=Habropoda laboriosa TaxID=597456 RepID=A0A0L7QTE0_9HYME|nr:hypothetical protein WH47_06178 [Habropoda laboriosa]
MKNMDSPIDAIVRSRNADAGLSNERRSRIVASRLARGVTTSVQRWASSRRRDRERASSSLSLSLTIPSTKCHVVVRSSLARMEGTNLFTKYLYKTCNNSRGLIEQHPRRAQLLEILDESDGERILFLTYQLTKRKKERETVVSGAVLFQRFEGSILRADIDPQS